MLNVQNMTAKLASLPDQALQQYAAMNKNDPYIMALAVSESNRRKQIRAAQQAQGMQEQPKVVDQAVAEMAPQQPMPEDVGIGQLPAGEMEFAEGGILAFAPGGATGGPNASFVQFLSSIGKSAKDFVEATPKEQQALKAAFEKATQGPRMPAPTAAAPAAAAPSAAATSTTPKAGALGRLSRYLQNPYVLGLGATYEASKIPAVRDAVSGTYDAIKDFAMSDRFLSDEDRAVIQPPPPAPPAPRPAVPAGSTIESDAMRNRSRAAVAQDKASEKPVSESDAAITEALAAATALTTGRSQGLPALPKSSLPTDRKGYEELYGLGALGKQYDDLEKKGKAAVTAQGEADKKALAKINRDNKALGEYGVEREAKLNKQLKELEGKEDKNVSMALLEAGLAMMAGNSQYAFENIGKGALVGTKAYKEGVDKIDARRDKLDEALANLQDIRRGEKKATMAETRAAEAKVDSNAAGLARVTYEVGRDKLNMTKEIATTAANSYVNSVLQTEKIAADRDIASAGLVAGDRRLQAELMTRLAIARLPTGDLQLYQQLGDGDIKSGVDAMAAIKAKYAQQANREDAYAKFRAELIKGGITEGLPSFAEFNAMYKDNWEAPTGNATVVKPK